MPSYHVHTSKQVQSFIADPVNDDDDDDADDELVWVQVITGDRYRWSTRGRSWRKRSDFESSIWPIIPTTSTDHDGAFTRRESVESRRRRRRRPRPAVCRQQRKRRLPPRRQPIPAIRSRSRHSIRPPGFHFQRIPPTPSRPTR